MCVFYKPNPGIGKKYGIMAGLQHYRKSLSQVHQLLRVTIKDRQDRGISLGTQLLILGIVIETCLHAVDDIIHNSVHGCSFYCIIPARITKIIKENTACKQCFQGPSTAAILLL